MIKKYYDLKTIPIFNAEIYPLDNESCINNLLKENEGGWNYEY